MEPADAHYDELEIERKTALEQLWPMTLLAEVARRNELPGAVASTKKWSEELKKCLAPLTEISSYAEVNNELEGVKEYVTIECLEGEVFVDRAFKEQCQMLDVTNDGLKAFLSGDHRTCKICKNGVWCAEKEIIGLIPSSA